LHSSARRFSDQDQHNFFITGNRLPWQYYFAQPKSPFAEGTDLHTSILTISEKEKPWMSAPLIQAVTELNRRRLCLDSCSPLFLDNNFLTDYPVMR